ncbi:MULTISPECIES: DnaD domain-containing protein [Staphylococcus]|uniref:DNA replication protein DnaD n=1 Tax=Staphylococcus agnetis TaxID=985762 RepID=A0A242VIB9_9STAP|nr:MULTISPECIES: DnaD domain-containing protein [Staphylococcus]ALN76436.1 DnaD domain-containing protein [Staphylococcus agnetis]MBY7664096.1 DnaD domain-containing protein [Staphylococcus agnetis]MCO4326759.1 DnaD domain-containing protein [Staphylococcus agnetis]MCO4357649.1 DnaD domain-containing protein [Staphylococcus agnetis]MCO4362723.1 DnaD domain-containing protein [Staphylococcus agnetis]
MNARELQIRPVVIRYELLNYYQALGLNEADLIILIKILHAYEVSNLQPSIDVLKQGTTMQETEVTMIIQKLIRLDLLSMKVEKDHDGKFSEFINMDGFFNQFAKVLEQEKQKLELENDTAHFKRLFSKIETNFGRALSPLEIETISQWLDVDHYPHQLIDAAIDEALSHNKLNLKYIDRILLNWQKNNVTTVEDSKPIRAKFKKQSQEGAKKIENFPKFDWLNGESPNGK